MGNEIIVVVAHGGDILDCIGSDDLLDTKNRVFTAMEIGGASSHPYNTVTEYLKNTAVLTGGLTPSARNR